MNVFQVFSGLLLVKIAQFSFEFFARLTMTTIKALLRGKMVGDNPTMSPFVGLFPHLLSFVGSEYPAALPPLLLPSMLVIQYKVISKTRLSRDSLLNKGTSVAIKVD